MKLIQLENLLINKKITKMSFFHDFINLKKYKCLKEIGGGSFGKVFLVENKKTKEKYAAKRVLLLIDDSEDSSNKAKFLFREIGIMSALNHPSFVRSIGFSPLDFEGSFYPTLIMEYAPNGSLRDLIFLESKNETPTEWNDTTKLITIYGIASGMAYLHKNNIIHRDLKPENILMDKSYHPLITDLGLAKSIDQMPNNLNTQTTESVKGSPAYISPEIFNDMTYSFAGDVYAFGLIVNEIFTGKASFANAGQLTIVKELFEGNRPDMNYDTPEKFADLIQRCWAQDPGDRPSFADIIDEIRSDEGYITEKVDKDAFRAYVHKVDDYKSTFSEPDISYDDFLAEAKAWEKKEKLAMDDQKELKKSKKILYPAEDLERLDEGCRKLVKDAEKDPNKQFIVGRHLMDGSGHFAQNTQLAIKYVRHASKAGCSEASLFLARLYVEGDVVPEDVEDAKKILATVSDKEDGDYLTLLGRVEQKRGRPKAAFKSMKKAAKAGNAEAMYRLAMMYTSGEGTEKDEKKAGQYLELAKKNGYTPKEQDGQKEEVKDDEEDASESSSDKKVTIVEPASEKPQKVTIVEPFPQSPQPKITNHGSNYNFQLRNNGRGLVEVRSQIIQPLQIFSPAEEKSTSPPIEVNMTFIGDSDDLKHGLVSYLAQERETGAEFTTMAVTFYGEQVNIKLVENQQIESSVSELYYKFTDIFVMIYSLTDKSTLDSLRTRWSSEIAPYKSRAYVVLMGTQLELWSDDKSNDNFVTLDEIKATQRAIEANTSIRCSYVTGENITDFKNKIIGSYIMHFYNPDNLLDANTKKLEDIKVLLVGNWDGGQYQLLQFIQDDDFDPDAKVTPVKKVDKTVTLKKKNVKNMHFFSTPGDSKCQKVRIMAYSDTQIVLLVFSLTNIKSFVSISEYAKEVMQFAQNAAVILVGVDVDNWTDDKADLSIVHSYHVKSFMATSNVLTFIKCSYVTGLNMDSFYEKILDAYEDFKKKKRKRRLSLHSPKK